MDKISLSDLFQVFLKIGGFTFGGGYAMLPLIEEEFVERRELIKEEEFIDMIAVIQGIPGIIAINSSLFIGYRLRGIMGALTSALAMSLPSVIIITLIANILLHIHDNQIVLAVFSGIRATVVVLIFWAGYRMSKKAIINRWSLLYTFGMVVGMLVLKVHPIILILSAGIISIILSGELKEGNNDLN